MRQTSVRLVQVKVNGQDFWQVIAPRAGGRGRTRRTFKKRAEAKTYFDSARVEIMNRGTHGLSFGDALRADALAAIEILEPFDVTLAYAARHYAKAHERNKTSASVPAAIESFLIQKERDGARPRYVKDLRIRLNRFAQDFEPERTIASFGVGEIQDWLAGLGVAPLTQNTFWLRLSALWSFSVNRGWAAENIVARIPKVKARGRGAKIGILAPEELGRLLEHAATETLPYWLLGGFAGLRSAELERLEWSDIHFDAGLVEVPALKAKTASRRFVQIQPNLAAWLEPYRNCAGTIAPKGLRKRLEADRQAAELAHWSPNALRHSFASYYLAKFQDAAKLALALGHTDQDLIFAHYRELVRPAAAERYWSIAPVAPGRVVELVQAQ